MPIVTVQMTKGRDAAVKRRLAGEITRLLAETLDVEPEWVTVLFQELERENWATGGCLHSDQWPWLWPPGRRSIAVGGRGAPVRERPSGSQGLFGGAWAAPRAAW